MEEEKRADKRRRMNQKTIGRKIESNQVSTDQRKKKTDTEYTLHTSHMPYLLLHHSELPTGRKRKRQGKQEIKREKQKYTDIMYMI